MNGYNLRHYGALFAICLLQNEKKKEINLVECVYNFQFYINLLVYKPLKGKSGEKKK